MKPGPRPASLALRPARRTLSTRMAKLTRSAADFLPPRPLASLPVLRAAAARCRGCDLYLRGTQTVFGQGLPSARLMLVGEQPGDQEDRAGLPFVGPAGQMLDRAIAEAGLNRADVYITNAVKHFKWVPAPRGKRRLHAKPSAGQIRACRPWLEQELRAVGPSVLMLLGATAAQSLLGPAFRVSKERGKVIRGTPWAPAVMASLHPSAVLRAPDEAARAELYAALVTDLRAAAKLLAARPSAGAAARSRRAGAGSRAKPAPRAARGRSGAEETRTPNP